MSGPSLAGPTPVLGEASSIDPATVGQQDVVCVACGANVSAGAKHARECDYAPVEGVPCEPSMPPLRFYIAGPMSGYPGHNFAAFHTMAERLRAAGFEAICPAEDGDVGEQGEALYPRSWYMLRDLRYVLGPVDGASVGGVVLLPGWEESRGARCEVAVARECGIPVYTWDDEEGCLRACAYESVLEEALLLAGGGDRNSTYGHPLDNLGQTGRLWTTQLSKKLLPGAEITAEEVSYCMIHVKLSRLSHAYKRDSLVDIGGYAQTAEMAHRERERRERLARAPK